MKKQLIEQLVNMSDLELVETLELLFNQRKKPVEGDLEYQEALMIVEHTGDLNSESGGFLPSSIDKAKFIVLPIDRNNLKIPTPRFDLSGECPNCGVKVVRCDILVKYSYCYSEVECQ